MGAVSAEGPGVVERQDRRHLPAEPRQRSQVEVATVQVVAVDEVRARGRQIEEAVGARKLEILPAHALVRQRAWMRGESKRPAERSPSRAGKPTRHLPQSLLEGQIARHAADGTVVIGDEEDSEIAAALLSHGHPRCSRAPDNLTGGWFHYRRGAASRLDCPDLQNAQRPI